jgi:hypothetical protein
VAATTAGGTGGVLRAVGDGRGLVLAGPVVAGLVVAGLVVAGLVVAGGTVAVAVGGLDKAIG